MDLDSICLTLNKIYSYQALCSLLKIVYNHLTHAGISHITIRGRRGRDRIIFVQSIHMPTNVVSSKCAHCDLCSIHHYVCQWLATGRWFSPGIPVFSINKTDGYDITEILLKVALNIINY